MVTIAAKRSLARSGGNHVGDIEHITVRLDLDLNPVLVYYSVHDFSYTIAWNDAEKYGGHPVAYSAWGSHGLWPSVGDHKYKDVPALVDRCSKGVAWDSWDSVICFDYGARSGLSGSPWPAWMSTDYLNAGPGDPSAPGGAGIYRWGNPRQGVCLGGECQLNDGPTGMADKYDVWNPEVLG
jgi:hypothetical protein